MRREPGTGIPKRAMAGKVGRNGQVSTLHRRIFVKRVADYIRRCVQRLHNDGRDGRTQTAMKCPWQRLLYCFHVILGV